MGMIDIFTSDWTSDKLSSGRKAAVDQPNNQLTGHMSCHSARKRDTNMINMLLQ